jgi:DNA polymerase-3 subunit beta
MKFTVGSTEFQRIAGKLGGVIQAKTTMPILDHFLFDLVNHTLTITATDTTIWMQVELTVQGEEDGQLAVPAKRLMDTLRQLPDLDFEFTADTTSHRVNLRTLSGEYNMTGAGASDFPPVPEASASQTFELKGSLFQKIVQKTMFAVSQDEMRPAMQGVLLQAENGKLTAVATDGHRFVRFIVNAPVTTTEKHDIVLYVKTVNIVSKAISDETLTVKFSKQYVEFVIGTTRVISRLIEAPYPNYAAVIPPLESYTKVLRVGRDQMVQAIRRVSLYSSAITHQIRFDIARDEIRITAQDTDFGWDAKEKLPCEFSDNVMLIGFNGGYVVDLLTHMDGEKAMFRFSEPNKAGIIVPDKTEEGEDLLMLVMPLRLNA